MNSEIPKQLILGVQLRDETTFENFHASAANSALVQSLIAAPRTEHLMYLWGAAASGRSHLMQALCHQQTLLGQAVLYLPMLDRNQFDPLMLQGTNSLSMVCLDDIDAICGDEAWESAVFQLYNTLQETDTHLLVSATCAPQQLAIALPDLCSRLQSGLVYQLASSTDAEKCDILRLRAENRGMFLAEQVAEYIVQRAGRSTTELMDVLEKLDQATLERGRRLTKPLIKEVMGW